MSNFTTAEARLDFKRKFDEGEVTIDEYVDYLEHAVFREDLKRAFASDSSVSFELNASALNVGMISAFSGALAAFGLYDFVTIRPSDVASAETLRDSVKILSALCLLVCGGAWSVRRDLKVQVQRLEEKGQ